MELPTIDKTLLAKMGIASNAAPIMPAVDFGIKIPKKKTQKLRDLTKEECISMFGKHEAVYMNFIPQMLIALALEQAEEFVNYCRDNHLSEYKKYNREIRKCIAEYNYELRQSYGAIWNTYQEYLERVRYYVTIDLFKCWCTFTNEAAKQFVGIQHKDLPARVAFIRMLLTYVEDFEKGVDKVVASRLNTPCYRKQNGFLFLISLLCVDIAETFGYKMDITETMAICVKVLANKCRDVARQIIGEEEAEQVALIDKT